MNTLSISKVLDLITENSVQTYALSKFESVITLKNELTITGFLTLKKFKKYEDILIKNGFQKSKENWFNKSEDIDAYQISIEYSKTGV